MNWNFLGAGLNLTHYAGLQRTYRVRFRRQDGEAAELTNVTFGGAVTDADGSVTDIVCWAVGGEPPELGVQFNALGAGTYRYEVWSQADGGEVVKLFGGSLQVLGTAVTPASAVYSGYKTLEVMLPSGAGERLQAQFLASSAAEWSAVQAGREADRAKGEADRAEELTSGLQDSIDEINRLIERTDDLFRAAEEAGDAIQQAVSYSVSISENETWVIGGVDTGKPSRGRDGFSPYIALGGNWWTFSDETREYVDTGVSARGQDGHSPFMDQDGWWHEYNEVSGTYEQTDVCGKGRDGQDGMDADSVVRHVVNSYAEIPQEGETCNGHHYYYIAADSGAADAGAAYMWAETIVGQMGWVNIGNTWDVATVSRVGGMKLGTSTTITSGAVVGLNSALQAMVPVATLNSFGAVRLGSARQQTSDEPYSQSVGAASDGKLKNNLLIGGALQHWLGGDWTSYGYTFIGQLDGSQYYTGIKTTASFGQSQEDGLSLNASTTTELGGVYRATGADDPREEAVPSVAQVKAIVSSVAYTQGDVYTQAQTQGYVAAQLEANNANYYTRAEVDQMLAAQEATINAAWAGALESARAEVSTELQAAKTELQAWVQAQGYVSESVLGGYVRASGTVEEVQVLTEEQHNALTNPNAKTVYISGGA